jgi:hypothetical protein
MNSMPAPGVAEASRVRPWRATLVYGLMLLAAVGLFLVIRSCGEALQAPSLEGAAGARVAAPSQRGDSLLDLLLAL